ncbi:MAG: iron ABC transporter permease [Spirochaetae bacterium HGW-Spirochaetae-8]|nr:MAG: iron ABC transporter permease [Spirochaetae bacterium HGW-Spirochaetae-8]
MGGGYESVSKEPRVNANRSILDTSRFYRSLGVPALVILAFLFILPLSIVLSKAFVDSDGGFTFSRLIDNLTSAYTLRILLFTLFQALVSTVASVLVGLPGAYLLATYRFPGRRIIRAICTIPFVLPSILVVLGFVIFYGNNGLVNQLLIRLFGLEEPPLRILYSFTAIIMAHAFYNFPIALGLISSFWEQLPAHCNQAAAILGAKRWTVFRTITIPRLMPAILSAATLIFLFCFSSFAIMLVLGGGPQFTTLEVEIYRRARMTMDQGGAAALSLLSIVVALVLILIYSWTQRSLARQEEIQETVQGRLPRSPRSLRAKLLVVCYTVFSMVFVLGPLVGIVVRSFQAPGSRSGDLEFSLKWYEQLFGIQSQAGSILGTAGTAILLSITIATVTAIVSLIIGAMTAATLRLSKGKVNLPRELMAMLPMAVSSVIIGLGYYLISSFFNESRTTGAILIVLAHVVIASPFVLRTILPEYRKIPFSYTQASLTLGATVPQTFFKVELPLLRGALATGAAFAFAISMGEINATLVLANAQVITLPVVMYRLIGSYNFPGACALGTLLIVCCALVFTLTESFKRRPHA